VHIGWCATESRAAEVEATVLAGKGGFSIH
jgi:hypothetical protein